MYNPFEFLLTRQVHAAKYKETCIYVADKAQSQSFHEVIERFQIFHEFPVLVRRFAKWLNKSGISSNCLSSFRCSTACSQDLKHYTRNFRSFSVFVSTSWPSLLRAAGERLFIGNAIAGRVRTASSTIQKLQVLILGEWHPPKSAPLTQLPAKRPLHKISVRMAKRCFLFGEPTLDLS